VLSFSPSENPGIGGALPAFFLVRPPFFSRACVWWLRRGTAGLAAGSARAVCNEECGVEEKKRTERGARPSHTRVFPQTRSRLCVCTKKEAARAAGPPHVTPALLLRQGGGHLLCGACLTRRMGAAAAGRCACKTEVQCGDAHSAFSTTSPRPSPISIPDTHSPSQCAHPQAGGAMEAFMIKTGFYDKCVCVCVSPRSQATVCRLLPIIHHSPPQIIRVCSSPPSLPPSSTHPRTHTPQGH
jgi:hypothetical protein